MEKTFDGFLQKIFQIHVKSYDAHPKMKFEKHLVSVYPKKYKDYELVFEGKLLRSRYSKHFYDWFLEFDEVDFPLRKPSSVKKK